VPNLVASYTVANAANNANTLTTPSFTPAVGEVIVVKGVGAAPTASMSTPTDSQTNAYTSRKTGPNTGNNVWA
jgi:hypothetical protein